MKKSGFTLIELSIVLVIIGLIIGGVLVGQNLIRTAQLRGDITAIDKFDAAANTFKLKYGCIPGDCANATSFLSSGAYNGNGSGFLDGVDVGDPNYPNAQFATGTFIGTEFAYAIDDLARASLINVNAFDANDSNINTDTITPKLATGGRFMVRRECVYDAGSSYCLGTQRHTYRLGVSDGSGGQGPGTMGTENPPYNGADAYYIDTKIDDGKAASGSVIGGNPNTSSDDNPFIPISANFVNYLSGDCSGGGAPNIGLTDTCQYDRTITDKLVGLFIRAKF